MKTLPIVLLTGLIAFSLGCGYSKPATTPPTTGSMPTIAALVPASTSAGTSMGPNGLMVTGTNFNANATINWNGTALTTAFVSGTQLTATVPDADTATAGTTAVTVTNPANPGGGIYGSGGTTAVTSAPMTFTIN